MSTYLEKLAINATRARRFRARNPKAKQAANAKYYLNNKWRVMEINAAWLARNRKWVAMQIKERRVGLPVTPIKLLREQFP